jgi:hypothetical protein
MFRALHVWSGPRLPLAAALVFTNCPLALRADVEPHYWRERVFFIPYQPNLGDPQADRIDKVQLLLARDGAQPWAVLQEAEPHVRGFSYHAAADGEYAFALRMTDRRGRVWPEVITQPLLRVIVDTQAPTLQLAASLDAAGQATIRYEARDLKLKPETLRVEIQVDDGPWQPMALAPPDVNHPDRLLGLLARHPPTADVAVRFRASVDDVAGNHSTASAEAAPIGPQLNPTAGPQLYAPGAKPIAVEPRPGSGS